MKQPITTEEKGIYKGLEYEIKINPWGFRLGYVKVPFKLKKKDLNKIECHWGITFQEGNIIGFDCLHFGDAIDKYIVIDDSLYKTGCFSTGKVWRATDVREECYHIIDQLIKIRS